MNVTVAPASAPDQPDYPFPDLPAAGERIEVAPGIGWLRMPLPFALDHINLWTVDDGERLVAIDSGLATEAIREAWTRVLAEDGRPLSRMVVTHYHPDHLGLATWLAARDGAPIHMTYGEYFGGHATWHQIAGYAIPDMLALFREHGLDEERLEALGARGNVYRRGVPEMPQRIERMHDGDLLRIGAHDWRVITGHGHSPEHASLYCASLGVLISGDMLLPRISTNISVFAATPEDDPLGRFLASLRRFCELPADTLVLPSHGKPFRGIRARVDQLVEHHRERCAALVAECDTPHSAGELLETLFPRALDTHQSMFAMGEAIAHLNHLVRRGELRRVRSEDGTIRHVTTG
ncbi:MAG: MBL fold metallo-hydrolase [Thauera phenolivorans]|uniref:MBL fold metallo-hydrolase n=1 Tax=Thauera phenolivorans TaxID=1792543 RepID=A0A7X7LXY6_9RHOO|nr:MBL fold metallo-hydrolase [Thauera phenolivorans]